MADHLPAGTVVPGPRGHYEVLGVVGRGGMGVVYRARRDDGSIWALKEQRPAEPLKPAEVAESRQLFQAEAERVLSLNHPNVVAGEDFFTWQDRQYFVMELVNGETLEKRLREANAPAFEQDALRWTVQMARVLQYLHQLQPPIIYRDLKPANVILTPDSTIKFIDFGVARTHKMGKAKDTVAIGTFGYAPPEQYGKGQTDARSDVYTLGATLFHLLTNLPPRPLYTPKVGEIQGLNPSVQPQTEQIVIRAMQQDRDARYASAAEMERDLQASLGQPLPAAALPARPQGPASRPEPATVAPRTSVPDDDATQRTAAPPVPPRSRSTRIAPPSVPVESPPLRPRQPVASVAPVGSEQRFCGNCGRANKPAARFCVSCGTPLPAMMPAQPNAALPAAQPLPEIRPQPVTLPQARFMVTTPRGSWQFPLQALPVRIGRRDPSQNYYPELDLADYDRGHASRRHAVVERRGDQYVLTDVGSVNGTLLNSQPIPPHRPQTLRPRDRVRIGDVELRFETN